MMEFEEVTLTFTRLPNGELLTDGLKADTTVVVSYELFSETMRLSDDGRFYPYEFVPAAVFGRRGIACCVVESSDR